MPTDDRDRLRQMLLERSMRFGEFVLSSGATSNYYIDVRKTSLHPDGLKLISKLFWDILKNDDITAVGGLTLGADPLATATSVVSWQAGRPRAAFLVRKEPKGHGTQKWIEGEKLLRSGMPVVIVEDVITTGASTLKAIERARHAGFHVVHAIGLVDRLEGGREAVIREVPLTTLFTRRDFLPDLPADPPR